MRMPLYGECHPPLCCTEPATSPVVGRGSWLIAAHWSSAGSRETWSLLVLAKSWSKASGTCSHPVQLSKPASVRGGTQRMQLQPRLRGINVEEVDCGSGPGRRQGVPGGLSRQQQLGRELQT